MLVSCLGYLWPRYWYAPGDHADGRAMCLVRLITHLHSLQQSNAGNFAHIWYILPLSFSLESNQHIQ
jgi:hypothetical protein